ncbi:MAG TPA: tRNA (5-methylaminomethyl-2-thiouridine)(34)-methyltransferase MnmD [Draconibacterium sp.]|nr:tRNA (5-methylaminomethyl-2-thiouridine)(34)-methyltransferase MnmD [Draconibacterium sp.]
MEYERKIIATADGSKTLFIPAMNEQYHSVNGALTESDYVFLEKGFRYHPSASPGIFEVGFGTGLNALLTVLEAEKSKRYTHFTSIEKHPLTKDEINALNYGTLLSEEAVEIFRKLHSAEWETDVRISEYFSLHKIKADLKSWEIKNRGGYDVIYFDAFGPDKQPDMWDATILSKIYDACSQGAIFVTYSAKGEIRRRLESCGFKMERLPGPPGKRQMLRGKK